jgi:hypothetical protein
MSARIVSTAGTKAVEKFPEIFYAKVTSTADPLNQHRLQLSIPQVLGTAKSNWAAPVGFPPDATIPPVGTVIYAMFVGGDRNHPVYFPRSWKGISVEADDSWLNVVTGFGADPTGSTDSTTAIQAAITAGPGNTVFFPTGTYLISSELLVPPSTSPLNGVVLRGSGWGSVLAFNQATVSTLIGLSGSTQGKCDIRDLRIVQNGSADGGTAVNMNNFVDSIIDNVSIDGGTGGKHCTFGIIGNSVSTFYNVISNTRVSVNGSGAIGIAFEGGANSNAIQDVRVLVGTAGGTGSSGIYINAHSCRIEHADIENNPGNGVFLDTLGSGTTMIGVYLENNHVNLQFGAGVQSPTVLGCTIQSGVSSNILDNGAISPVVLNGWANSGNVGFAEIGLPTTTAPATATGGAVMYGSGGHGLYLSTDGNSYDTGRLTAFVPSSGQTINATTPITNMSISTAAGTYRFKAVLTFHGSVASGNAIWELTGAATTVCQYSFKNTSQSGSSATVTSQFNTGLSNTFTSQTLTTSATSQDVIIEGLATFSSAGLFVVECTSSSATNVIIHAGSFLELLPVV